MRSQKSQKEANLHVLPPIKVYLSKDIYVDKWKCGSRTTGAKENKRGQILGDKEGLSVGMDMSY